jgi:hypothetical protein
MRWWRPEEIDAETPGTFDPAFNRFMGKLPAHI